MTPGILDSDSNPIRVGDKVTFVKWGNKYHGKLIRSNGEVKIQADSGVIYCRGMIEKIYKA